MTKTKEQLEEEKKISLSIRIKPLDVDAMDQDQRTVGGREENLPLHQNQTPRCRCYGPRPKNSWRKRRKSPSPSESNPSMSMLWTQTNLGPRPRSFGIPLSDLRPRNTILRKGRRGRTTTLKSSRRDRNRLAAAKCRQKRLDQIADLQVEVAKWEMKNRSLEEEVASLREEKEELQYVLAAHRQSCTLQIKVEQEESQSQSPVPEPVKPQRPASLSLTPVTVKNIEGVPIDTPSNGILSFNTL